MTLVKKLPFTVDIKKLQNNLYYIIENYPMIPGPVDRLTIKDKKENIDLIIGTSWGLVYKKIAGLYTINSAYLIKVPPLTTLAEHTDRKENVLVPITADKEYECIVDGKQISVPADGSMYLVNALLPHSGNNLGKNPSYRLVFSIVYYRPRAIYEGWSNYT